MKKLLVLVAALGVSAAYANQNTTTADPAKSGTESATTYEQQKTVVKQKKAVSDMEKTEAELAEEAKKSEEEKSN